MHFEKNGPKKVGRFWHKEGLSWIDISIESSVADHFAKNFGKDTSYIELYLVQVENYKYIERNLNENLNSFVDKLKGDTKILSPDSGYIKVMCAYLKSSKATKFQMDVILNRSSNVKTYQSKEVNLIDNQDYALVFFDCTDTIQKDTRNYHKFTNEDHYLAFNYKIDLKSSSLNHLSYEDTYIFEANLVFFLIYGIFGLIYMKVFLSQNTDVFNVDFPMVILMGSITGQVLALFLRGLNCAV